ncbi:MAG: hypothetical protein V1820_04815 [archaeon]
MGTPSETDYKELLGKFEQLRTCTLSEDRDYFAHLSLPETMNAINFIEAQLGKPNASLKIAPFERVFSISNVRISPRTRFEELYLWDRLCCDAEARLHAGSPPTTALSAEEYSALVPLLVKDAQIPLVARQVLKSAPETEGALNAYAISFHDLCNFFVLSTVLGECSESDAVREAYGKSAMAAVGAVGKAAAFLEDEGCERGHAYLACFGRRAESFCSELPANVRAAIPIFSGLVSTTNLADLKAAYAGYSRELMQNFLKGPAQGNR